MRARVLCLLALCLVSEGFAAKKDFKGLFGSYRREKFTENEGRATDYGMDILLSTLLPVTSLVNSNENSVATSGTPMAYATFFNVESSFFFTVNYNWQVFFSVAYYSYDTRKQKSGGGTPQFHLFSLEAAPLIAGVKYRFGAGDIVPYVGAGAGMVYSHRKAYYDYSNSADETYSWGLAAQLMGGLEFYISPRAGIRLEVSGMYMGLTSKTFAPGQAILPAMFYQPNPIAVRYASGLFLLF